MKPNFGELSPKMIELLSKGEIAVENDNADILRKIIGIAFPDSCTPSGNANLYHKNNGVVGDWANGNPDGVPIYKATDFIIPEKFCILVNDENREEIKRIAYACGMDKDDMGTILTFNHGNQYYSFENGILIKCSIEPNDNELTFDHFKLLFDGGEEEKEIEKYIPKTKKYWEAIKKICNYTEKENIEWKDEYFHPSTMFHRKAKELGVIDLWFEPIYKSKEVIIKVGKCQIPVHVIPGKRIFAKHGGREIDIDYGFLNRQSIQFSEIICNMKGGIFFTLTNANFSVSLNGETTQNVTLEEINKIIQTYNNH